jgi:hypothetical protein
MKRFERYLSGNINNPYVTNCHNIDIKRISLELLYYIQNCVDKYINAVHIRIVVASDPSFYKKEQFLLPYTSLFCKGKIRSYLYME